MFPMTTLDAAWRTGRNNFNLIRLVAASLVIWSHAWAITGTAGHDHFARLSTRSAGAFAVDVFFVISGFLVAASCERNPWRDFLRARALRIYPALVVCVALTVGVLGPILSTAPDYWSNAGTWRYLWSNATLWRAEYFLPGVFETLPRTAVNGSLWTLPIEGRLYLALFVAGLLGMLAPKRYVPSWALAIAGAAGFAWWSQPLPEHLEYLLWVTAFFITGTLLWVLRAKVPLSWWLWLPMLAVAALTRGTPGFVPAYVVTVAYGVFCLAFRAPLPRIERTDLSYGLYLYGWPMQQVALLAGAASVAANTLAATALALACAAASWFLVERPALRWKRGRATPANGSAPPAQAAGSVDGIAP
jgi:peptidoglycan/LPS O-acetylase OafA/YrhL